jgi:basic membrane protein A
MKKKTLRKIVALIMSILVISSMAAGCGNKKADSQTDKTDTTDTKQKVALILSGSISDGSWNEGAYNGIQWLEKNREDVETTYVENVAVDDSKLVIQNLIDEKYGVIIAFASEYSDVIDELAEENPEVYFIDTNVYGEDRPSNVTALNGNQGEGAFLVGVIAASLSKTGKIGSVEGFDYGDLSDNYVNYVAGAKYVNPDIETVISYVGSWSDTEKSKQTALAQIESGVDFIYASGDLIGVGVIAACEEKNVPVIGYGDDLNELAPKQVISTVNWNTGITFGTVLDKIKDGTFESTVYSASLAEGSITLASYHGLLDKDTQKLVETVKNGIIDGSIKTEK